MSVPLYDPNDEKDAAARRGIYTHQKAIVSLDAKIASLLDVVETLQGLKRDHEDELRRCKSVLALPGRLPADLLQQIFESCAEASPLTPLFLSQVCSAWRVAAHSRPSLWSRIFINCSDRHSAEKAEHWLSMSGDHVSLQITLFLPHNASLIQVMRILLLHGSRWTKIIVDAEVSSQASEVLVILRQQRCVLRRLHTIHFLVHGEMESIINFQETINIDTCPRLRTIHLLSTSWHLATFPPQITVLHLTAPTTWIHPQVVPQMLNLFRELPGLEIFSLVFSNGSFSGHGDDLVSVGDVTIPMTHLNTLVLDGCDPIFQVQAYLIVPSLRRLGLRATGEGSPQTRTVGRHLKRMIELSSPPLRSIELYDVDASDDDFAWCFRHLPELEELLLHESEISDAVFRPFCFSLPQGGSYNSWICPQLRRLDLRWCSQLSGKVLVELVKARLESSETSRILEVVVINCSFVREEDVFSLADITVCRLDNRPEDFCYNRGCCINNRYRHRFMLRHAAELRQRHNRGGRLEL